MKARLHLHAMIMSSSSECICSDTPTEGLILPPSLEYFGVGGVHLQVIPWNSQYGVVRTFTTRLDILRSSYFIWVWKSIS